MWREKDARTGVLILSTLYLRQLLIVSLTQQILTQPFHGIEI